jgi:hypothetical protein
MKRQISSLFVALKTFSSWPWEPRLFLARTQAWSNLVASMISTSQSKQSTVSLSKVARLIVILELLEHESSWRIEDSTLGESSKACLPMQHLGQACYSS